MKRRKRKAIAISNGWQERLAFPRSSHRKSAKEKADSLEGCKMKVRKKNEVIPYGWHIIMPTGWKRKRERIANCLRGLNGKELICADLADQTQTASLDEIGLAFYNAHFSEGLAIKNRRYIDSGRGDRVQTIAQIYCNRKTAPEETISQIRTRNGEKLDEKRLGLIITKQLEWERERFPQVHYLSCILYMGDAKKTAYVRTLRVWIAHDKEGREIISPKKSLQEMEIERPDISKKAYRYNNPKMTYTAMCRKNLLQLCASYGLDIANE